MKDHMASTSRGNNNCHFFGEYEDDKSQLESGLYKNESYDDDDDDDDDHNESEAIGEGSSIDPRLLMLIKYFKELYVREAELFKKIFPGVLQDEFAEFSEKIGAILLSSRVKMKQRQAKTMRRSLSLGSHRTRGIVGVGSLIRAGRFKVRTVVVDEGVGHGQGGCHGGQLGHGDNTNSSSASKHTVI